MFALTRCVRRTASYGRSLRPYTKQQHEPTGSMAAPFTPFNANGKVDWEKYPAYMKHLNSFGIRTVFANGTTGEGLSLSVEERKRVAEIWIKAKPTSLDHIILHIGAGNLTDSIDLAAHAESCGVDAIACIAPSYFRPQSERALVDYMKCVAAAAPKTPFYLYDISFMTNISLNLEIFLDLASGEIPTLRGIKHSTPDLSSLSRCHQHSQEKFHIMFGSDELLLPALALGVNDSICSSFMVPIQERIRAAFKEGNMEKARLEQMRCLKFSNIKQKYGTGPMAFSVSRAIVRMLGFDLGPPRLPLLEVKGLQYKSLEKELQDIGFFKWALLN